MATRSFRRSIVGIFAVVLVVGLSAWGATPALAVCYVSPAGSGSCSGWGDTCSLQTALNPGKCSEIWVEKGVYKPGSSQSDAFIIEPNVAVYGGFAGTESTRSERNPAVNVTVLSGDLLGDDVHDANGVDETVDLAHNSDNSYHVVVFDTASVPVDPSTVLDGLTITAGASNAEGGGLVCDAGSGTCSPKLEDLTFSGNSAESGGAIYLTATGGGEASPTLTNVTFSGNGALDGGAIYIDTGDGGLVSPSLTNVTFGGNRATSHGGAMDSQVGVNGLSSTSFTNVTFSGNSADRGGGIDIEAQNIGGTATSTLVNVILWGDLASTAPEVDISQANGGAAGATIDTSVVEGGCPTGATCNNLVSGNPNLGPLQYNGGFTDTMALRAGSSAIDTGDDGSCPATDQRGITRPQDGNGDGSAICDIGAYEALPPVTAIPTLSPWALLLLALGLALAAAPMLVRRS